MMTQIKNIAVIGCSGAIGNAFTKLLLKTHPYATIHAFSRQKLTDIPTEVIHHYINYEDESSIEKAALIATKKLPIDLAIVATGFLHNDKISPEKSLRELSAEKFLKLYSANAITPALIAKYFLPKLNRNTISIFAAISARIGSISDNQLGGWYGYRASKAALNMIIKNASIEIKRNNKNAIIVGLHPGTVDSNLSRPFQAKVPDGKLFTPSYSCEKLLEVLKSLSPDNSGKCFAWDGTEILP